MANIWSEYNKFNTWKKVEITVTEVLSDMGDVPKEAVRIINEKADFSVERILEIEKTEVFREKYINNICNAFFKYTVRKIGS